jgi:hypothetical protein
MDVTFDFATLISVEGRATSQLNAELIALKSDMRIVDIRARGLHIYEDSLGRPQVAYASDSGGLPLDAVRPTRLEWEELPYSFPLCKQVFGTDDDPT